MLSITSVIAILVSLALAFLARRASARKRFKGLPRVGIDPGFLGLRLPAAKSQFFEQGQKLLEIGYAQVGHLLQLISDQCP